MKALRPTLLFFLLAGCGGSQGQASLPAVPSSEADRAASAVSLAFVGRKDGQTSEVWSDGSLMKFVELTATNNERVGVTLAGYQTPSGFFMSQPQAEIMQSADGVKWERPFLAPADFAPPPNKLSLAPAETASLLIPLPQNAEKAATWRACIAVEGSRVCTAGFQMQ